MIAKNKNETLKKSKTTLHLKGKCTSPVFAPLLPDCAQSYVAAYYATYADKLNTYLLRPHKSFLTKLQLAFYLRHMKNTLIVTLKDKKYITFRDIVRMHVLRKKIVHFSIPIFLLKSNRKLHAEVKQINEKFRDYEM